MRNRVRIASLPLLVGVVLMWGCGGQTNGGGSARDAAVHMGTGSGLPDGAPSDGATRDTGVIFSADDAAACVIDASQYDHSCTVDSDCVVTVGTFPHAFSVSSGNFCDPQCSCDLDVINQTAATQYLSAISQTPLGSGGITMQSCGCPEHPQSCCLNGQCAFSSQCGTQSQAGITDAAVQDGPQGAPLDAGVLCSATAGPLDSGASQPGVSQYCLAESTCTSFNGGWECCSVSDSGSLSFCIAP
jgi:hypothetical protein